MKATCGSINDTSRFILAETKLKTIIKRQYYEGNGHGSLS